MTLVEKVIFLEDNIEKLNLAIYQQDKKIADLEKTIQLLHKDIQSKLSKQANDDLPPHY